jgi:hypothetical protein
VIQYRENGEPIPDGRITIEISRALAEVWDPVTDGPPLYKTPEQTYVFEFKDISFLREGQYCFSIIFPSDRGERANTRLQIPWGQILSIQVDKNSDEYASEMRKFRDGGIVEFYDTRNGGTCLGCASRG